MSWGMNVDTNDNPFKFVDVCVANGIELFKLNLGNDWSSIQSLVSKMNKTEAKFYVSPFVFEDSADQDQLFDLIKNDKSFLLEAYRNIASKLPKEKCLGIALPRNTHLVIRAGKSKVGIRREALRDMLSDVSEEIRSLGHTVVFPMNLDDLQLDAWGSVPFDVYDLETMVSHRAMTKLRRLDKPLWLGKLGLMGGYINPLHQAKFLRVMDKYAQNSRFGYYAFLHSESFCEKHQWTIDGEFVVDVKRKGLKNKTNKINKKFKRGNKPPKT